MSSQNICNLFVEEGMSPAGICRMITDIQKLVQGPGSKKCLILGVSLTHLVESWDPLYKLLQGVSYVVGWDVLKIMRPTKNIGHF